MTVAGYRIEVSTDGGRTWQDRVALFLWPSTNVEATARVSGYAPGETRLYRVRAVTDGGIEGPPSNVVSATFGHGVRSIEVVSRPAFGDGYAAGERIEVEVTMSTPMRYAAPRLPLVIGAQRRDATCGGEGAVACPNGASATLRLSYTVQADDSDADGIAVAEDTLAGTRYEQPSGAYATPDAQSRSLVHPEFGPFTGHAVHGGPPVAAFAGPVALGEGATVALEVVLSRPVREAVTLAWSTEPDETAISAAADAQASDPAPASTPRQASADDYTPASGSVTIAAGARRAAFVLSAGTDDLDEYDDSFLVTLEPVEGVELDATRFQTSVTIRDATPAPGLEAFGEETAEGGELNFHVSFTGSRNARHRVLAWSTADGTATAEEDYTAVAAGTLRIAPGADHATVTVDTLDDTAREDPETLSVRFAYAAGETDAAARAAADASGRILDADTAGVLPAAQWRNLPFVRRVPSTTWSVPNTIELQFFIDSGSGNSPITFRIDESTDGGRTWRVLEPSWPGVLNRSMTYEHTGLVAGSAHHYRVRGIDARGEEGLPSVAAGTTAADGVLGIEPVSRPASGDSYRAGEEIAIRVRLSGLWNVHDGRVRFRLGDEARDAQCRETVLGTCKFTSVSEFDAFYVVQPEDLDADGIAIAADSVWGNGLIDDIFAVQLFGLLEDGGMPHAAVGPLAGHKVAGGGARVQVSGAEVAEGGTLVFPVTVFPAQESAVTVAWASADGTAVAGEDYTAASGTVIFAPGETEKSAAVATVTDTRDEADETVTLTLLSAEGAPPAETHRSATGVIVDDDDPPALRLAGVRVAEGAEAVVALRLASPSGFPVTVTWETADGTALAGEDYTAVSSGTLTLEPGAERAALRVATRDDSTAEGEERFTVRARHAAFAGGAGEAAVTILDTGDSTIDYDGSLTPPAAPTETIWSATISVGTAQGRANGFWAADGTGQLLPGGAFTYHGVDYVVTAIGQDGTVRLDTAIPPEDRPSLVFRTGRRYVEFARAGFATEGGEFVVTVDDGLSASLGWVAGDSVPVALLAFTTPSEPIDLTAVAVEGSSAALSWTAPRVTSSGGVAGYRIEQSDDGGGTWRVRVPSTGNAQTAWRDTGLVARQTRHYRVRAIGASGRTGPISESASVTMAHGVRSIEVTSAPALAGQSYRVREILELTATFTTDAELFGASMALALGDGTVSAACVETHGRCLASPSVALRYEVRADEVDADGIGWAANPFSGTVYATVDGVQMGLSYPAAGPLDGHRVDGRALEVSVADAAVVEGGTASFEVTLSRAISEHVEVGWSSADATAVAGEDYTPVAAGTLTIAAGTESASLEVATVQDALDEAAERFTVTLTSATSATAGVALDADAMSATATIADDDSPPTVTLEGVTVVEGGAAVVAVRLSAPSGREITIAWSTADATATAGEDYTAVAAGMLTIAARETAAALSVTTVDDAVPEGPETFLVRAARRPYPEETTPGASLEAVVTLTEESGATFPGGGAMTPGGTVEEVWSATLTVAQSHGDRGFHDEIHGQLSNENFRYGGTLHRARQVLYDTSPSPGATPHLEVLIEPSIAGSGAPFGHLAEAGPPELVLRVGRRYFRFGAARWLDFPGSMSGIVAGLYIFSEFLPDWEPGDRVELAILALTHPTAPTALAVRGAGAQSVELSWTAPDLAGASAAGGAASIAGYRIEASDDRGATWRDLAANTGGDATSYIDTAVAFGASRRYRVSAVNDRGTVGPASEAAEGTALHGMSSLEMTSAPADGVSYRAGEAIEVTATFTVEADLFDNPSMALALGAATVHAACVETAGRCRATPSVVFRHVVAEGDLDEDGIGWAADATSGSGFTVADAAQLTLAHGAAGPFAAHKVDGRAQSVSIADAPEVAEGAPAAFPVTLRHRALRDLVVTWSTVDGSAAAGEDYTAVAAATLTIAAGATGASIAVESIDDALDEGAETLTVRLDSVAWGESSSAALEVNPSAPQATATLRDDDRAPAVTVADVSVVEGEEAVLEAVLAGPSGRDVQIAWETVAQTAQGKAIAGEDYTAVTDGMLTIVAGGTRGSFTVATLDDARYEAPETFRVRVIRQPYGNGQGQQVRPNPEVTIENDGDTSLAGGGHVATIVAVEEVWSATLTIGERGHTFGYGGAQSDIGMLSDDDFRRGLEDYTVTLIHYGGGELQFALDKALAAADAADLVLQVGARYLPLSEASYQHTGGYHYYIFTGLSLGWTDGDTVALRLHAYTQPLAPSGLTAQVAGTRAVELDWMAPAASGGAAIAGYRVEASDDGGASWRDLAADTGTTATAYRDATIGFGATRHYRISAINAGRASSAASEIVSATTLHGIMSLAVTSAPAHGGQTHVAGEAIEITVELSTPAELSGASMALALGGAAVTAACVETGGRCLASPAVVFRHVVAAGEVDADGIGWAAGALAGTATATSDGAAFDLSHPAAGPLAGHRVEGRALTVSVSGAPVIDEGAEAAFEVALTHELTHDVEVTWSTSDVTAVAGQDYTAVSSGTLTIAPGTTTASLAVATAVDALDEVAETFIVTLDAATGGAAVDADASAATATIIDDVDDVPPALVVDGVSVAEGDDAVLEIRLTRPSGREITVMWSTSDDTATAGEDYTAVSSGTLTVAPNEARGEISVSTLINDPIEAEERFTVRLARQPFDGEAAPEALEATVTILADGAPPGLTVAGISVAEGDAAVLTAVLAEDYSRDLTFSWSTSDGTATAAEDYTAVSSGTLTFARGETEQTIRISTLADTYREASETFDVEFTRTAIAGETPAPEPYLTEVTIMANAGDFLPDGGRSAPGAATSVVWSATLTVGTTDRGHHKRPVGIYQRFRCVIRQPDGRNSVRARRARLRDPPPHKPRDLAAQLELSALARDRPQSFASGVRYAKSRAAGRGSILRAAPCRDERVLYEYDIQLRRHRARLVGRR